MAAQSNIYAGVAGYVGRPEEKGAVGVFRRSAAGGEWQHVLKELETHAVFVHPKDPNIVFAGTVDGIWRSTDNGATFQRANFPDRNKQIWCFLVDSRDSRRMYAGGSPVDVYRSDDSGASWRRLPNPGIKDRATAPFAVRVMRMVQHPTRPDEIYAALEVNGVIRTTNGGETWEDCGADLIRLSELPHLKSKIVTRHIRRGHARRPRHHHQPGRSRRRRSCLPHGALPLLGQRQDLAGHGHEAVLAHHLRARRERSAARPQDHVLLRSASPPPARTAASIAARMPARPGRASTRSRCTARSCQSACTRPTRSRSISALAIRARSSARRMAARRWSAMPLPGPVKDIYSVACG